MSQRESLFGRYKRLKQYKDKTDKEIYALIDEKLSAKEAEIDFSDVFGTDKNDLKKANELVRQYLSDREFDNIAERQNLKNIVWLEVELSKNQEIINKLHGDADKYVPDEQLKSIISIMKQVSDLKKELGFYQKEKEESDGYKIVERMMERAKVWREKNQGSRTLICPHCQKMTLLKIRTEDYDPQKHPFFEDRILTNKALMKLYCENKLSKKEVAEVLEVSEFYVDWLINKWKTHPDYEQMISEFNSRTKKPKDNS